ncbi:MAG: hypothetical protein LRY54_03725 [Alphaproteobacteria bacterium]|nr:hypothetical protein [Alphaproteobacteria bacterium]
MWIAMAGMVLATLAIYPDPTILDLVVGLPMHLMSGASQIVGAGLPAVKAIAANTMSGHILPNHLGDMWAAVTSGASHAGAAAAGHVHGAVSGVISNQWDWFASLTESARNMMISDASFFNMPLDQYLADWCSQNGLTFSPS